MATPSWSRLPAARAELARDLVAAQAFRQAALQDWGQILREAQDPALAAEAGDKIAALSVEIQDGADRLVVLLEGAEVEDLALLLPDA